MGQQFNRPAAFGIHRIGLASLAIVLTAMIVNVNAQESQQPKVLRVRRPSTQAASTQPGGAAGASTQPAGAATRPTTQPGSDGPPTPAGKISLNYKDAPLDTVLDNLSGAAGFAVIKDGPVEGRVTVTSKQPVTPSEAVTLLSAALKANGYTAIQEGKILRIVQREKAKKGSIPVTFGDDPELVSPTDELITQVIPIHNIDAVKLKADLQPLLNTEADVATTSASNAILVTDSSANIRRLMKIIKALDQRESSSSDIRVVQLKYANAAQMAKLIGEMFKGGGGGMSPQQIQMMQMQGQPIPAGGGSREGIIPGGGIDQALRGGKVTASADERTNTLIITGPKETLKIIDEQIIKELDANPIAGNTEIRAFILNYAKAEDTAKLITTIFKGDESDSNNEDYYWGYRRWGGSQDNALKVKVNAAFDERTNSVIVTAPPATLKVIEGLIKQLDANPIATADLKVFHLKNADAFDVSLLLEEIFKPKAEDRSGSDFGWVRFVYGSNPNVKTPKMTSTYDDRTNSVIVTAPTEMLKAIEDVINQLDTNPASEESLFIYRLRNAQSDNLEIVLNTLFGNIQNNQQNQNQTQDQQRQDQFRQNRDNRNNQNGGNRSSSSSGRQRQGNNRASRNGNNRRQGNQQIPQGLTRAITELSGKVFVVADTDTNSLLVTTASKYEAQVRGIIADLDRQVPQVLIKVLVAEVTHNDDVDYGVDFSVLDTSTSGRGVIAGTNFGLANATGGLLVKGLGQDINVTLRALESVGKIDVLSRPYVLASDNQLANILVGQNIPRVQNTRITDSGQQITDVTHENIGIILDVTPHINPDGQVILDVAPEISSLSDLSLAISPGVQEPVINTRSAESRVEVKDGQTVVIGGLMEDRKTSTIDKVPIIGDIPWIGELFKHTRHSKVKTELLIFITPHVTEGTAGLEDMTGDEVRTTRLAPNAVAPGVFQKHLNDMRRGGIPSTRPADGATTQPTTNHSAPAEHSKPAEHSAPPPSEVHAQ